MRKFLSLFLAFSSALAQSAPEMRQTAGTDFEKADKKLNAVYTKLLSTLDAGGKQKLLASEKAWLTYRDAQARFEADYNARGGNMASVFYNTACTEITEERIKTLKNLLWVGPG